MWVKRHWMSLGSLKRWALLRGNEICSLEGGDARGSAVWRGARPGLSCRTAVVTGVGECGRCLLRHKDFAKSEESMPRLPPSAGVGQNISGTFLGSSRGNRKQQAGKSRLSLQGGATRFEATKDGNRALSPSREAVQGCTVRDALVPTSLGTVVQGPCS